MSHWLPDFLWKDIMNISHIYIKEPYMCKFWLNGECQLFSRDCITTCECFEQQENLVEGRSNERTKWN